MFNFFKKEPEAAKIYSPVAGKAIAVTEMTDPMFARKLLGDGVAIEPSEGKIYAPFDGLVTLVPDTKHALGLKASDGTEVLIHIGIETSKLAGEGYKPKVKQGDSFKKGELLMEFDLEGIKAKGYIVTTPVIITSTDNVKEIVNTTADKVDNESVIIEYKLK